MTGRAVTGRSGTGRRSSTDVVVCHCLAVNDRAILAAIVAGALDADELAERCGAGGRCGGCRPVIEALLAQSAVAVSVGAGH